MSVIDSQFSNRRADLVLNLHECFEANGIRNGRKICKNIQLDIDECNRFTLRDKAVNEIHRVRSKKILNGELKASETKLEPAPANSFLYWPYHR